MPLAPANHTKKGENTMKAIVSLIVALGLAFAFSGSALAAKVVHCKSSEDCPSPMHCSIKHHHKTGVCVGAYIPVPRY